MTQAFVSVVEKHVHFSLADHPKSAITVYCACLWALKSISRKPPGICSSYPRTDL